MPMSSKLSEISWKLFGFSVWLSACMRIDGDLSDMIWKVSVWLNGRFTVSLPALDSVHSRVVKQFEAGLNSK